MRLIAFSDGASGEFSATLWTFPTSSNCGTAMFVMAASATQNSRIGTESRRMVCGMKGRSRCSWLIGGSSGFVQAEGVGVHFVDGPFIFDFSVDCDAAAEGVTIALCHNVSDDGGLGCGDREGPGQGRVHDLPRLGVDVQVVDGRDGARCAKDLEDHLFGVERDDLVG